jgi:hypothetical protein
MDSAQAILRLVYGPPKIAFAIVHGVNPLMSRSLYTVILSANVPDVGVLVFDGKAEPEVCQSYVDMTALSER